MKSFVIKKLPKKMEIVSFNFNIQGFNYKPRIIKNDFAIKEVTIINEEIINTLINFSFHKKYKEILKMIIANIDDETSGSYILALDEIARLRSIIINKYRLLLKKQEVDKYLKKLKLLENEIRVKIMEIKLIKEQNLVNNKERELSR